MSEKLKSKQTESGNPASLSFAPARKVARVEDCFFYHTMELPGVGIVPGEWDLRGSEKKYVGQLDLSGKTVLEIGPASGGLTFWMERQGADVVAYDLDEKHSWDIVPFRNLDLARLDQERSEMIKKLNNSWWFARERLGAHARCSYGSVYELNESAGRFDIVTINSVLLHVRDPLLAIQCAAATCEKQIVITDVSERQFAASKPALQAEPCLHFMPRAEAGGPTDGWWFVPSTLVVEMLKILGFKSVAVSFHTQKFKDEHLWEFYTIVGSR